MSEKIFLKTLDFGRGLNFGCVDGANAQDQARAGKQKAADIGRRFKDNADLPFFPRRLLL